MTMQIRKAERKKAKLRLGIAAPSGAGKTMGALLLAFGITGDWSKVGLADTEAGSGELYVGQVVNGITIGEYQYCRIDPDYSVDKYLEALSLFAKAGVECGVLDSVSHAWSGVGGLLDKQSKIADRTGNSYTAWRSVTPDHNLFVDTMLASPFHLIATMRSKQEYVLETNDKGKQAPKKVGMAPVQREGMEYEFTVMFDIDMNHIASASKDRTNSFDGKYFKITPDTGKQLLEWLELGKEPEKDIKQLTKEFADAIEIAPTSELFEKCIADNAVITGRLATELPAWHAKLLVNIEKKRASFLPQPAPKTEAPAKQDALDEALDIPQFLRRDTTPVERKFDEVKAKNIAALQQDVAEAAE